MSAKPVSYIPQSPRLLDQLREVLRYKHYSLRTEEAYLYWVKFLSAGMAATDNSAIRATWAPQRWSSFCLCAPLSATCPYPPTNSAKAYSFGIDSGGGGGLAGPNFVG